MKYSESCSRLALIALIYVASIVEGRAAAVCDTVAQVPTDAKQAANGVVNTSPFTAEFTGGQAAYVKVRNDSVHLTPITVIIKDGKSARSYCESTLQIAPQKTLVFTTSVFGDRIYWGIRVAVGDVDAAQLSVNAFASEDKKKPK